MTYTSTSSAGYNNNVWTSWTGSTNTATTSTSTTSSTSSNNLVWYNWTTADTCGIGDSYTATTAGDFVWITWASDSTGTVRCVHTPETTEQRAAREAEQAERQAEFDRHLKEAAAKARIAEQKAFLLLKLCLSDEEVTTLETEKHITVKGSKSGTVYRIRKGRAINVDVMDNGKVKHKLCFHPREAVPDYDTMLAQKLMLEYDEPAALRIANVH